MLGGVRIWYNGNMTHKYWTKEDYKALEEAISYKQLFDIALKILARMPDSPRTQVCGPISTGGKGSFEANMEYIDSVIKKLQEDGVNVFDQMPFEIPMSKIKKLNPVEGYDYNLLNDFYLPIFESGLVHKLYFLPDWKSSTGSKWEHEQAERLGLEIGYMK